MVGCLTARLEIATKSIIGKPLQPTAGRRCRYGTGEFASPPDSFIAITRESHSKHDCCFYFFTSQAAHPKNRGSVVLTAEPRFLLLLTYFVKLLYEMLNRTAERPGRFKFRPLFLNLLLMLI